MVGRERRARWPEELREAYERWRTLPRSGRAALARKPELADDHPDRLAWSYARARRHLTRVAVGKDRWATLGEAEHLQTLFHYDLVETATKSQGDALLARAKSYLETDDTLWSLGTTKTTASGMQPLAPVLPDRPMLYWLEVLRRAAASPQHPAALALFLITARDSRWLPAWLASRFKLRGNAVPIAAWAKHSASDQGVRALLGADTLVVAALGAAAAQRLLEPLQSRVADVQHSLNPFDSSTLDLQSGSRHIRHVETKTRHTVTMLLDLVQPQWRATIEVDWLLYTARHDSWGSLVDGWTRDEVARRLAGRLATASVTSGGRVVLALLREGRPGLLGNVARHATPALRLVLARTLVVDTARRINQVSEGRAAPNYAWDSSFDDVAWALRYMQQEAWLDVREWFDQRVAVTLRAVPKRYDPQRSDRVRAQAAVMRLGAHLLQGTPELRASVLPALLQMIEEKLPEWEWTDELGIDLTSQTAEPLMNALELLAGHLDREDRVRIADVAGRAWVLLRLGPLRRNKAEERRILFAVQCDLPLLNWKSSRHLLCAMLDGGMLKATGDVTARLRVLQERQHFATMKLEDVVDAARQLKHERRTSAITSLQTALVLIEQARLRDDLSLTSYLWVASLLAEQAQLEPERAETQRRVVRWKRWLSKQR